MHLQSDQILNILDAVCLIPFLYVISQGVFKVLKKRNASFSIPLMNKLFFYHIFFGASYYIYALFNPSDSKKYFLRPQNPVKNWLDFFGTETTFIDFISYPFINWLGFSYEMIMISFTWIGFLGFVYAYSFFKENINLDVKVFKGIDLLTLILFLPNMHFWTASLGKGAPIFFGLMLFAYSITKPKLRVLGIVAGSLLIFYIRPHMFFLVGVGAAIAFITTKNKISFKSKAIVLGIFVLSMFILQNQILAVVNLDNSSDLVEDFVQFTSKRAEDLNNAGSGVNMAGYTFPEKIFTFWFRPLFFDAPGILGIIISIENFIYLLLFIKIIKFDFLTYLRESIIAVRMSMILFILTSFAMTFVMSNLGIIIRQKSMIMYFLFFVIYNYLANREMLNKGFKRKDELLALK